MVRIGVTERGDAGLDFAWMNKSHSVDGMILITKHLSYAFIDRIVKTNAIVHATITGNGGTIYEPNVPPLSISKQYFSKLVERIGPDRVVLRIDPIIPTDSGIAKAIFVYQQLHERKSKQPPPINQSKLILEDLIIHSLHLQTPHNSYTP